MEKKRELWVDYLKVMACMLVVLGHFFQGLVASDIIESNFVYDWFNTTIYYFHVPIFFACSGYLYQKTVSVRTLSEWKTNITKKMVAFGIPYIVFSVITWGLKNLFSDAVNSGVGELGETLLFHSVGPYWYLYCLFFIFFLTPTMKTQKDEILIFIFALLLKAVSIFGSSNQVLASYSLWTVLTNEIWFVAGMIAFKKKKEIKKIIKLKTAVVLQVFFILMSILLQITGYRNPIISFFMTSIAIVSLISIYITVVKKKVLFFEMISKYTWPIYLMHTIISAPVRSFLLKFGVNNSIIHILFGIFASVYGPIIATKILSKVKFLDGILYPGKYIRVK